MTIPSKTDLPDLRETLHVERGFFKGYIDLIIRHDNRWWVVDWKTNIPTGATDLDAYNVQGLEGMIAEHRYDLQYRFYLLALVRRLYGVFRRPIDWDAEIGGALYLFVRGTREGDARGVYAAHPLRDEMRGWATALGIDEVIV